MADFVMVITAAPAGKRLVCFPVEPHVREMASAY